MRTLLAAALVAGGFVAAGPASAVECRLGFEYQYLATVAGHDVYGCAPWLGPCHEPGSCPPPPDRR